MHAAKIKPINILARNLSCVLFILDLVERRNATLMTFRGEWDLMPSRIRILTEMKMTKLKRVELSAPQVSTH
jgi:hypothetical protein